MAVRGILPVIPTPLRDGVYDPGSFERLLDHMLADVDGYTLLGSTGEAPSMTAEQRMRIVDHALSVTPPDKTVVVGVSHTSVTESIALARHAQTAGAAAVLCSVPYYFSNTPSGILRYLAQLDAALEIDLVLYDNPVATKTALQTDWVLMWAGELDHLRSVKLTDHDLSKIATWQHAGLTVMAGDDVLVFEYLRSGVDGSMVIAPAVLPASYRAVAELMAAGDALAAVDRFARELAPFLHIFGLGEEIATTKALLHEIGVFASAEVLPPLVAVNGPRSAVLRRAYEIGSAAALELS
jgi:4-hydroxy-tetrahydrodipicolinate synthase